MTFTEVQNELNKITFPFLGRPREALKALEAYPPGFAFLYVLIAVDAEIGGEGIDGLHRYSTWHLVFPLQQRATTLGFPELAQVLKEVIYYYDRRGQSRLRHQLPPRFFDEMPTDWAKSLDELADEFDFAKPLPERVVAEHPELFDAIAKRESTNGVSIKNTSSGAIK
jgi:hypothetical protein